MTIELTFPPESPTARQIFTRFEQQPWTTPFLDATVISLVQDQEEEFLRRLELLGFQQDERLKMLSTSGWMSTLAEDLSSIERFADSYQEVNRIKRTIGGDLYHLVAEEQDGDSWTFTFYLMTRILQYVTLADDERPSIDCVVQIIPNAQIGVVEDTPR